MSPGGRGFCEQKAFETMNILPVLPTLASLLLAGAAAAQSAGADAAGVLFQQADLDGNGRLSRVEFDAARETLFARADANRDSRLTLSELRALRPEGSPRPRRRLGREQFQRLRGIDRNNDRAVDIAEFRAMGAQRFAGADANRDGYIDRGEIAGMALALGVGG